MSMSGGCRRKRHRRPCRALCRLFSRRSSPVPSSARRAFLPQVAAGLRADPERLVLGLQLIGWGLFKKVVDCRQSGAAGRSQLRHRRLRLADRAPDQRLFLRIPDLLRLLRLYRHRHRRVAAVRPATDGEFPPALSVAQHRRVLGRALAHLARALVPRLPLYPARRQPGRARCAATSTSCSCSSSAAYGTPVSATAWAGRFCLGRAERRLSMDWAGHARPSGVGLGELLPRLAPSTPLLVAARAADLSSDRDRLGLLPRQIGRRRVRHPAARSGRALPRCRACSSRYPFTRRALSGFRPDRLC